MPNSRIKVDFRPIDQTSFLLEQKGIGLVATQRITRGEEILREKPLLSFDAALYCDAMDVLRLEGKLSDKFNQIILGKTQSLDDDGLGPNLW